MILKSFLESHGDREPGAYRPKQKQMLTEYNLFNKSIPLLSSVSHSSTSCDICKREFSLGISGFIQDHISLTWYSESGLILYLVASHYLASLKLVETSGLCQVKFSLVYDHYTAPTTMPWWHHGITVGLMGSVERTRKQKIKEDLRNQTDESCLDPPPAYSVALVKCLNLSKPCQQNGYNYTSFIRLFLRSAWNNVKPSSQSRIEILSTLF